MRTDFQLPPPLSGPTPHGIDQPEGPAVAPHVLRGAAAQQEDVFSGRFADQLQAAAKGLDVRLVRIVQHGVAEVVVLVAEIDVLRLNGGAGREAVHLEEAIAPVVRDLVDVIVQIFSRCRVGHVHARSAPGRIERLAVGPLGEPVLMVLEPGIVPGAGEGHEPDARREAVGADHVGRLLHAGRIRAVGPHAGKILPRAVLGNAVLPAIVDLQEVEAEGGQFLGGDFRLLDHRLSFDAPAWYQVQ